MVKHIRYEVFILRELFDSLKKISIARRITRYFLGVLFVVLGLVFGYLFGRIFFLIGIMLAMAESIILLSVNIKRNTKLERLIEDTYNTYFPQMKKISNSKSLEEAYNTFDLANISRYKEGSYTMAGEIDGITVNLALIRCKFNGCLNYSYIRMYTFDGVSNLDIRSFNNRCLRAYRYEIRNNTLYLIMAGDKPDSLYPRCYQSYDTWVLRLQDENIFINEMVKLIGGRKNEEFSN